ncbi:hypothetical protein [Ensifer soli]|uniref:hypothetical protein n=1 Tax=Ciceribacter sp. sgz301302 TaxID=3342379 RepID=UPI0035B7688A
MTDQDEKAARRPRGASPRGDFDLSKKAAKDAIEESRAQTARKTEALRRMRLEREQQNGGKR